MECSLPTSELALSRAMRTRLAISGSSPLMQVTIATTMPCGQITLRESVPHVTAKDVFSMEFYDSLVAELEGILAKDSAAALIWPGTLMSWINVH